MIAWTVCSMVAEIYLVAVRCVVNDTEGGPCLDAVQIVFNVRYPHVRANRETLTNWFCYST
jgi:hypothetical protein